jgi:hypothetical protein
MHVVVNHLPIKPDADWAEIARRFDRLAADTLPGHPEVRGMQVVQAGPEEAILVITFADAAAMADFSSQIAAPWFAEHIRPFLAGPADRKTGKLIADFPKA